MIRARGFTVIEALLVLAVVAVIFAFALEASSGIQKAAEGQGGVAAARDAFTLASERARLGVAESPWGVYLAYNEVTRVAESITVFAGASYTLRNPSYDLVVTLRPSLRVPNAALAGAGVSGGSDHEAVFAALDARTTQYGTVTFQVNDVQTLLQISSFGTVVEP
ncbi:MAG: prepilin-type N-terminal cleavage/methylation domain-containing protein [Patescibacteria group bacterium]